MINTAFGKWRIFRPKPKFLGYSDFSPVPSQMQTLFAIKKAWGGNFFGSDMWTKHSDGWYGVDVDSSGNVYGLELPASGITGPFPAEIGDLPSLIVIDLQGNSLTGRIPPGLFRKLPQLNELYLSSNQLTGDFPWAELSAHSFSMLELYGNGFTGTVPPSLFASMNQLQSLSLGGGNRFSGSIPDQFNSPILYELDFSGNQFTGAIPLSLVTLPSLVIIDFSGNQLTGYIPWSLSQIPYLVNLNLAGNKLSGRLPTNFTFGPALRSLILSGNFFTGYLPSLPNLAQGCPGADTSNCVYVTVTLDFSNNYLTGPTRLPVPLPGSNNFPGVTKACPYTDAPGHFFVGGNCLSSASGCEAQSQRADADCQSFCGTSSRAGQCSKRGMCVPGFGNGTATDPQFSCLCIRGFKATGANGWQCVRNVGA